MDVVFIISNVIEAFTGLALAISTEISSNVEKRDDFRTVFRIPLNPSPFFLLTSQNITGIVGPSDFANRNNK